jgi:hypothetical protein
MTRWPYGVERFIAGRLNEGKKLKYNYTQQSSFVQQTLIGLLAFMLIDEAR